MPAGPTRIGAGTAPAATPTPAAPPRQASALPSTPAVPTAKPLASATPARPPAPTPAPEHPTRVPGVLRKALAGSDEALQQHFPDAPPALREAARQWLATVVPAQFDRPAAERFGRDLQARHAALVDQLLATMDHEVLRNAPRHIERLLMLLEELAETLEPSTLPWQRRKPPRARLTALRPEIDALRDQLDAAEQPLARLRSQLATNQRDTQVLATELQGLALALDALPALLQRQGKPAPHGHDPVPLALQERLISVAKTSAALQQHTLQAEQADIQLAQLAARLHDAVQVSLPAWLASMAALPAEPAHDTERFVLLERLQAVIGQLRPASRGSA